MEQVNEVINNVTALVGTVLPQKESADAIKKVVPTTSEKMVKAKTRADNDDVSIKTEYVRSNERSESPQISSKSAKSVRDTMVDVSLSFSHLSSVNSQISSVSSKSVGEAVVKGPVARSRSNASAKSVASKRSTKSVAELPLTRSHSSVSTKSSALKKSSKSVEEAVGSRSSNASIKSVAASKTSTKSAEEISEVEESSVAGKSSESHIVVSYGSAEEKTFVKKNALQHERCSKNNIALAAYVFCALVFTVAIFRTVGLGNFRIQSSQVKIVTNDPTYYPTYMPTYMPTYEPTLDVEIATGKGSGTEKVTKTRGPRTHPHRDPV